MSDDLVPIDPWTQPITQIDLTPNLIASILINLSRELRALVIEYKRLGRKAAGARKDAEVAFARAFMTASGPMDERRQIAMDAAADARFKADLADREVASCKAAIQALHADIDVARTLSATTRDELKTLGVTT